MLFQARMQTYENGGANLRVFTKGGANLKKNLILRPIWGVNSVSGEKLHEFEIICPARECAFATLPPTPPHLLMGPFF